MNTLKVIQTLSKIGKILSRIVFVCYVVGFCGCIIGVISLGLGGEVFKLGGVTIHSIIESHSHMSMPTLYTAMAVGMVICAAEAVLSKLTCRRHSFHFERCKGVNAPGYPDYHDPSGHGDRLLHRRCHSR